MSGSKHSKETIEKIRKGHLGKKRPPFSDEWKRKISLSNRGRKWSIEARKRLSILKRGVKFTEEHKKNIGFSNLGKKRSIDARQKMRLVHLGRKSHFWKGGITPINLRTRSSLEYKLWRESVFKRDNYTCIWCGDNRGGNLEADHIKPFCDYPELRFSIDNGRTLCERCHKTTNTWGNKKLTFKQL